jgi:hypothetical protein
MGLVARPSLDAPELLDDATAANLRRLRSQANIRYDTARHPLRPAVLQCLDLPVGDSEALDEARLATLRGSGNEPLSHRERVGYRGPGTVWINRWHFAGHDPNSAEAQAKAQRTSLFNEVYWSFLREVVLQDIGDPSGILFQRDPTFRCHVADGAATGRRHCDSEYGHQTTELNYWLPLTRVCGSNSLYAESAPGVGDFEPFEAQYGEVVRFWGASCMHYTTANDSSSTRVSIDFRVVPRSCHQEGTRFTIGGFYLAMEADGSVPDIDSRARLVNQQRRKRDGQITELGACMVNPPPPPSPPSLPCQMCALPAPARELPRLVVHLRVDLVPRDEEEAALKQRSPCECWVRIDLTCSSSKRFQDAESAVTTPGHG